MLNTAFQDVLGVSLGLLLFPPVMMFPGYVISWAVDLFDFRKRHITTKHIIAILTSLSVAPVLIYLLALFSSFVAVKFIVIFILIVYLWILAPDLKSAINLRILASGGRYQKIAFLVALGWILLSMFSLVDLQWGTRLYNNVVSLDFATRATLINAISRTGVPPINPSYFPGYPEYISALYYFWYIICSVVDQLGGDIVDSRMALIAGDIWCGLALMALIGLYIKIRNQQTGESVWKVAVFGIYLLAVSGLDSIPASILLIGTRFAFGSMWPHGDMEHWNEQITAWVGALFWVPHHIAALIACFTGFMIFQVYRRGQLSGKLPVLIVAGLAFASAVGLSTWIAVAFVAFLGLWSIVLFVWKRDGGMFLLLLVTGLIALLFASPFLVGLLQGGAGEGGLPFAFEVRRFRFVAPFVDALSAATQNIAYLFVLPINYFLELGFFSIVGVLWLRHYRKHEMHPNQFMIPEILMVSMVVLAGSFVRSTVFVTNDFGWRVWLLGQFVLLIWATDVNESFSFLPEMQRFMKANLTARKNGVTKLLAFMLLIGFTTTGMELALLRFWPILVDMNVTGFPNSQSPDTKLGARTFDARLAYEFVNDELPEDVVIQQNPISDVDRIDRPSGLYANRQFAISYNAPFNVPLTVLKERAQQISEIFLLENQNSWDAIDRLCNQYFIDVLIVNEQDPLWKGIPLLARQRTVLYQNRYYAVLACGEFVVQAEQSLENTP